MSNIASDTNKRKFSAPIDIGYNKKRTTDNFDAAPKITFNDLPLEITTHIYSFLHKSLGSGALSFCLQRFPSHTIPEIIRNESSNKIINAVDEFGNTAIFYASLHPIYVLDALIKAGADVNWKNLRGQTIFHLLAKQGKKFLLHAERAIKTCINIDIRDNLQNSLLHLAIHPDYVCLILENNADINLQNMNGKTALHLAVEAWNVNLVSWLLECKADVNVQDIYGKTVLHTVAATSQTEILSLLLDNKVDVCIQTTEGLSALHVAATAGTVDFVTLLLRSKAEVNHRDKTGKTALHYAAAAWDEDLVHALLVNNADVNLQDYGGKTAIHVAAAVGEGGVVNVLLENGGNDILQDRDGKTALHDAAAAGDADLVLTLLKNQAAIDIQDMDGMTALHRAAAAGDADIVNLLLDHKADVNRQDQAGKTALHWARRSRTSISAQLVAAGADVNYQDRQGDTPLHGAEFQVAEILIEKGANVNAVNRNGVTALHIASEMVARLLIANGANRNAKDTDGKTPLHYAVMLDNQEQAISMLDLLVRRGAEVNVTDNEGKTPLHYAVKIVESQRSLTVTEALLKNDANTNLSDIEGKTPLHYATVRSQNSLITLLLEHGAKAGAKDCFAKTPLHYAAANCETNMCIILGLNLSTVNNLFHPINLRERYSAPSYPTAEHNYVINERDSEGVTALLYAIRKGFIVAAFALLIRGAKVNIADNSGITPLMAAVISNDGPPFHTTKRHIPALLCAYDANCTIRDVSAMTVFHYAAKSGMIEDITRSKFEDINAIDAEGNTALHYGTATERSMEALVKRGADVNIPNKDGRTVFHLLVGPEGIVSYGYDKLCYILREIHAPNINQRDRWGNTALDLASGTRVKDLLIKNGAIYGLNREAIVIFP